MGRSSTSVCLRGDLVPGATKFFESKFLATHDQYLPQIMQNRNPATCVVSSSILSTSKLASMDAIRTFCPSPSPSLPPSPPPAPLSPLPPRIHNVLTQLAYLRATSEEILHDDERFQLPRNDRRDHPVADDGSFSPSSPSPSSPRTQDSPHTSASSPSPSFRARSSDGGDGDEDADPEPPSPQAIPAFSRRFFSPSPDRHSPHTSLDPDRTPGTTSVFYHHDNPSPSPSPSPSPFEGRYDDRIASAHMMAPPKATVPDIIARRNKLRAQTTVMLAEDGVLLPPRRLAPAHAPVSSTSSSFHSLPSSTSPPAFVGEMRFSGTSPGQALRRERATTSPPRLGPSVPTPAQDHNPGIIRGTIGQTSRCLDVEVCYCRRRGHHLWWGWRL